MPGRTRARQRRAWRIARKFLINVRFPFSRSSTRYNQKGSQSNTEADDEVSSSSNSTQPDPLHLMASTAFLHAQPYLYNTFIAPPTYPFAPLPRPYPSILAPVPYYACSYPTASAYPLLPNNFLSANTIGNLNYAVHQSTGSNDGTTNPEAYGKAIIASSAESPNPNGRALSKTERTPVASNNAESVSGACYRAHPWYHPWYHPSLTWWPISTGQFAK